MAAAVALTTLLACSMKGSLALARGSNRRAGICSALALVTAPRQFARQASHRAVTSMMLGPRACWFQENRLRSRWLLVGSIDQSRWSVEARRNFTPHHGKASPARSCYVSNSKLIYSYNKLRVRDLFDYWGGLVSPVLVIYRTCNPDVKARGALAE